jgi:hypothetical protein
MGEPKNNNESPATPEVSPAKSEVNPTASGEQPPALTKEEQWAAFEKELKESDWGHQPC